MGVKKTTDSNKERKLLVGALNV